MIQNGTQQTSAKGQRQMTFEDRRMFNADQCTNKINLYEHKILTFKHRWLFNTGDL